MSALYKSGTVTVTNGSNIVTGSGTSFISIAGIVPGALFTINGVNWYEVYEVNTNTQIKVRTIPAGQTFQQATASGQDYAIFQNFTSLSPTEIAARVVAIQQKWHIREEEMTDWFASTNDFEEITNINGDKITVMTPFGVNNLLGSAATRDVGTADGNVLEAGTGGIGRVNGLPSGSSLQGEYENGFYYIPNATSRPTQNAASWYLTVENVNNNPTYRKYTATALGLVDDSPQPWTCLKINGVFTEWDRGALSQGYGLADAGSTDTFDFGDVRPKSGFYPVEIANSTGNKPVLNGFGTVEVIPGTTNNATHQFFYGRQPDTDIWFRTKRNSSVDYDPWVELYHSGNTNFNIFGGDSGDWVADGYAENSTTIVFKLDWNGISTPTALSILSGNFNIKNKTTGANLVSNITSLTLNSKSSRKSAVVQYTTTGLTRGTHYCLNAGATASFLLIS